MYPTCKNSIISREANQICATAAWHPKLTRSTSSNQLEYWSSGLLQSDARHVKCRTTQITCFSRHRRLFLERWTLVLLKIKRSPEHNLQYEADYNLNRRPKFGYRLFSQPPETAWPAWRMSTCTAWSPLRSRLYWFERQCMQGFELHRVRQVWVRNETTELIDHSRQSLNIHLTK